MVLRADFLKRMIGIGAGLVAAPLLPETSEPTAPIATTGYLQTTVTTSTFTREVDTSQWSYTCMALGETEDW